MLSGKGRADAVVADRLFARATGYSHPDVHIAQYEGRVIVTPIIKHYPPDTPAASLWLRNRQSDKWRDKPEIALTLNNSIIVDTNRPVEEWGKAELRAELARRNALPKIPVLNGRKENICLTNGSPPR
jgi:hypothetical protein